MPPEIVTDPRDPRLVMLVIDNTVQSTIDVTDPLHLVDEYVYHLAFLIDEAAEPGQPLRVLHLGAGALALARYVGAARPGSYQQAVEIDPEVVEVVRAGIPLRKGVKVKIRLGDAREQLATAPSDCYDVIVADIFSRAAVPAHVTTVEFLREAARVLRPGGHFAANICDGKNLVFSRGMAAATAEVFGDYALLAEPGIMRGRRFGNILLFGGLESLPTAEIRRRAAGSQFPFRVISGKEYGQFVAGFPSTTDATATASPPPPRSILESRVPNLLAGRTLLTQLVADFPQQGDLFGVSLFLRLNESRAYFLHWNDY